MLARCAKSIFAVLTAGSMMLCGVPAAAFAGDNATVKAQQATDEAIQECIDGLDGLEAGEDYDTEQIVVTYSGDDEPQAVQLEEGESVEGALQDAIDDDAVVAAQPNYFYSLMDVDEDISSSGSATDDTLLSEEYYLAGSSSSDSTTSGANVEEAWQLAKSNRSVTVAVLDTGIETNHADLKDNIDTAHMATADAEGSVEVGVADDCDGHGTHVAGIIAATSNNATGVSGVSYNARVLPICVFSKKKGVTNATTSTLRAVAALDYLDGLIESGELNDLHVINMSFGGYTYEGHMDDMFYSRLSHLRSEHNVLSVCSGGNGNGSTRAYTKVNYPSDWDVCVAVTALDKNGYNAKWSDYNEYKDISAPGVDILSTYSNSCAQENPDKLEGSYKKNSSYGYMSGTSMASPLVAGVFALMWATYPELTADEAVSIVKSTATTVKTSKNDAAGRSMVRGGSAGAINAATAVKAVQSLAVQNGGTYYTSPSEQPLTSTQPATVVITKTVTQRAIFLSSLEALLSDQQQQLKTARKKGGFLFYWEAQQGVAGYKVRIKKKKNGSWEKSNFKNSLAASGVAYDLKRNAKYILQVRAYRLDAAGKRIYGAWSAETIVKTK